MNTARQRHRPINPEPTETIDIDGVTYRDVHFKPNRKQRRQPLLLTAPSYPTVSKAARKTKNQRRKQSAKARCKR